MSEQSIFARLFFGLAGHSYRGLRLKQIAEGIGESEPTTLRNLKSMENDGLVEKTPLDDKRWRLTARVVQVSIAHSHEVLREEQALQEFKQRYSRAPN